MAAEIMAKVNEETASLGTLQLESQTAQPAQPVQPSMRPFPLTAGGADADQQAATDIFSGERTGERAAARGRGRGRGGGRGLGGGHGRGRTPQRPVQPADLAEQSQTAHLAQTVQPSSTRPIPLTAGGADADQQAATDIFSGGRAGGGAWPWSWPWRRSWPWSHPSAAGAACGFSRAAGPWPGTPPRPQHSATAHTPQCSALLAAAG